LHQYLDPVLALHSPDSTMIGTGLTPEGINQNDMIYDLMNEMGTWINQTLTSQQVQHWVLSYANRRYGGISDSVVKAWQFLTKSVYNCTDCWTDAKK